MNELITQEVYDRMEQLARRFAHSTGQDSYDQVQDIIGQGHDALMKAADTFKPEAGAEFMTWMHTIVHQEWNNARVHRSESLVPLPEKLSEQWRQWQKRRSVLAQEIGREPSLSEWAEYLDVDMDEFHKVRDACSQEYVSIDETQGEDEDNEEFTLQDVMAAEVPGPDEYYIAQETADTLRGFIDGLTPDETSIIYAMYGIGDEGGDGMTQEEVSDYMGIRQQRVSELHTRALAKLRGRGLDKALGIDASYDRPLSRFGEEG